MAIFNIRCLALTTWLMVGVLLVSGHGVWAQQCAADLARQCAYFVAKEGPQKLPSKECCDVVKTEVRPCICNLITKDMEKIISVEKIIFVAAYCGRPFAPGTKCGSITVPPSPFA